MSKERIYSEKDIQVLDDAVAFIRRRPDMFVGDNPTGASFAARVVECLILRDAGPLRVERSGSWYSISADKDWLVSESGAVSFEAFYRLVPMPNVGLFYNRAEVFLTALTDAVVTSGSDGTNWISGDKAVWKLPSELELLLLPKRGRIIAFHYGRFSAA
jgi:hypothetical protein